MRRLWLLALLPLAACGGSKHSSSALSVAPTTTAPPAAETTTGVPATTAPTSSTTAAPTIVATTAAPQSAAPATTAPPTTARPAATPTTAPAAPSGTVALQVANSSHGPILIDAANRHTVYLFTQDRGTTSACTGACSIYWPAVKAPAHPVGGPGVDNSKISVSNGQLVYNGHLLYMYSGDSAPGQVNGANVPDWYPVNPSGNQA